MTDPREDSRAGPPTWKHALPKSVGRYEIIEPLGSGGMGDVYRATDAQLGRDVALKILKADNPDSDDKERFLSEARMAAAIDHPFVCKIFEAGVDGDLGFLVMELIEGQSLRDLLDGSGIERTEVLRLVVEITEALEAAHSRGLVHRDLKPANVMVSFHGHAKLVDFGLAREFDSSSQRVETQSAEAPILGTLTYMAPEQLRDEALDGRTDLFALGTILHESVTGLHPFSRPSSSETMVSILQESPPLSGPWGELTGPLRELVATLLQKSPANRYQTARAVRADLLALLDRPDAGERLALRSLPSVAVLPFDNLSQENDSDFLAEGIAEEVTNVLARVPRIRVVARDSRPGVQHASQGLAEIAEALGVTLLLKGSVRRADERVRVVAQLIDARDGSVLWNRTFDRKLGDIFATQDEIAQDVAAEMQEHLSSSDLAPTRANVQSTDLGAYNHYLRGAFQLRRMTAASLKEAADGFRAALERDERYVPALVGLTQIDVIRGYWGEACAREAFPPAKQRLEQALRIDPRHPYALGAMAAIRSHFDWQKDEADRLFLAAQDAGPSVAVVYYMSASHNSAHGRQTEALALALRAQELAPLNPMLSNAPGYALYFAHRFEDAMEHFSGQAELHPSHPLPILGLTITLGQLGRLHEALRCAEKLEVLSGAVGTATLAGVLGQMGKTKRARELLEQIRSQATPTLPHHFEQASVYMGLGEHQNALKSITAAADAREPHLITISVSPTFSGLHIYPQFQETLARLGLR